MRRLLPLLLGLVVVLSSGVIATSLWQAAGAKTLEAAPSRPLPALGIDVWWVKRAPYLSVPAVREEAAALVTYLRSDLHANAVSIDFPLYTASIHSDRVFTLPTTPSVADIGIFCHLASAAGLRVELRPLLTVDSPRYVWRGRILPAHLGAFFASYAAALTPYLHLAQATHVPTVVYASELWHLSTERSAAPEWAALVRRLSLTYHGRLEYDSSGFPFLHDQVRVPGYGGYLDGYFAVHAGPAASERTLYLGWARQLRAVGPTRLAGAVLQEVGFAAVADGYEHPSRVVGGPTDPRYLPMERTWFDMVCQIVHHFDLGGVYFWTLDFGDDPLTPPADRSAAGPTIWADRPGASAIAACFSRF